ncbi:MAG: EamA family transporter RarD [Marmoricola sp.]
MNDERRGFLLGVAAYSMWGLFPIYWTLLEPAGAVEILAHRVCWSLLVMVGLTIALRRTSQLRGIISSPRLLGLLTLASVVIGLNWGGFIWGVNHERVVEVSLGYFINPLVTVLLGVFVLGERLRPLQWLAIGIAGLAVVVLTVDYGHPPWVAFLLAGSFGTYGLMKKKANVEAVESLTFETMILTPLALGYLVWLWADGTASFGAHGLSHSLLLASTGLITAVPLICFGAAAIRVSMTTIGLLQYLAPTIQFALGILFFHEEMTPVKWAGFALVWLALAIFTSEALRHRSRQLRVAAEASAL